MSGDPTTVRPATEADWPAIWPIFREVVEAQETYAYPLGLSAEQGRALWFAEPPGTTVVLVDDTVGGEVVLGTARMGPNRPGPGSHVGTASFMVAATARGRGVGRSLAEQVVAWHREQGYAAIQFNAVVETNTAALRLWRSLDFEVVGTVPEAFASPTHGRVGLHVMHLRL